MSKIAKFPVFLGELSSEAEKFYTFFKATFVCNIIFYVCTYYIICMYAPTNVGFRCIAMCLVDILNAFSF